MSEKPGRYQRSFGGLIGSMLVILVGLAAFVAFRELTREVPVTVAEPVEWRPSVAYAAEEGAVVVYPAEVDPDWTVTSAELVTSDPPVWGMGILTDDGAFVGLRQEDDDLDDLLEVFVDEDAEELDPVRLEGELGGEWRTFADEGGDHAYVLEREEDVVLVYGSASTSVLRDFVADLTEEPLTNP